MSDKPRFFPYIWGTWLAASLAGDDHCAWKFWYRVHFQFGKRPQSDEDENRLSVWKTQHAAAVAARTTLLRSAGYVVQVEDQNKFNVRGGTATVGGVADIVASREESELPFRGISMQPLSDRLLDPAGVVRVGDVKTGRRRASDFWQVCIYTAMLPRQFEHLKGHALSGVVVYGDGQRDISAEEATATHPRIFARIRELASPSAPDRTPSAQECRFCDIASCQDRVIDENLPVMTEDF